MVSTKGKPPRHSAAALEGTAIIEVGPEHKRYHVHKSLLTHHSEHFRNVFDGKLKEAKEGLVMLEDIEPRVFEIFIDWIYTQKIPTASLNWVEAENDTDSTIYTDDLGAQVLSAKALNFAKRFLAKEYQQIVRNSHVNFNIDAAPGYELVIYAFANFPSTDSFLTFLVDTHCKNWAEALDFNEDGEEGTETKLRSQLPNDFLIRVMTRYNKLRGDPSLEVLNRCSYHEHATKKEKKECEKESRVEDSSTDESDDE